MFICFVKLPRAHSTDKSKEKVGIAFLCASWKSGEDVGADAPPQENRDSCAAVPGLIPPAVTCSGGDPTESSACLLGRGVHSAQNSRERRGWWGRG